MANGKTDLERRRKRRRRRTQAIIIYTNRVPGISKYNQKNSNPYITSYG